MGFLRTLRAVLGDLWGFRWFLGILRVFQFSRASVTRRGGNVASICWDFRV